MLSRPYAESLGGAEASGQSPIARTTLTQRVYGEIKRRILAGELHPGDRLNEKELAAVMGVSPTPVREALNKLRGDGFIRYSAWQGATVAKLSAVDVAHLYDIRCTLERLAVREAAGNAVADDLQYLANLLARTPAAIAAGIVGAQQVHEINESFHQFFWERSGNRWLQQLIGGLNDLLILARQPLAAIKDGQESWREHLAVVAALQAGDAVAAEEAMGAHVNRVKMELLAHL